MMPACTRSARRVSGRFPQQLAAGRATHSMRLLVWDSFYGNASWPRIPGPLWPSRMPPVGCLLQESTVCRSSMHSRTPLALWRPRHRIVCLVNFARSLKWICSSGEDACVCVGRISRILGSFIAAVSSPIFCSFTTGFSFVSPIYSGKLWSSKSKRKSKRKSRRKSKRKSLKGAAPEWLASFCVRKQILIIKLLAGSPYAAAVRWIVAGSKIWIQLNFLNAILAIQKLKILFPLCSLA